MLKRVLVLCLIVSAACASKPSTGGSPTVPSRASVPADPTLAEAAKQELLHAWNGYKRHAWGHDELMPVSKKPRDWYGNESLLMTPVDTLSTFIIMGLDAETKADDRLHRAEPLVRQGHSRLELRDHHPHPRRTGERIPEHQRQAPPREGRGRREPAAAGVQVENRDAVPVRQPSDRRRGRGRVEPGGDRHASARVGRARRS